MVRLTHSGASASGTSVSVGYSPYLDNTFTPAADGRDGLLWTGGVVGSESPYELAVPESVSVPYATPSVGAGHALSTACQAGRGAWDRDEHAQLDVDAGPRGVQGCAEFCRQRGATYFGLTCPRAPSFLRHTAAARRATHSWTSA